MKSLFRHLCQNSRRAVAAALLFVLVGCTDAAQEPVHLPGFAAGAEATTVQISGWEVTLDVARVGIGPLYFCATASASSDLCPEALLEYRASAEFNALDPSAQPLGSLSGISGTVRSAVLDYAYSWLLTEPNAAATQGAPDGHSARFEGRARNTVTEFRFSADVDIQPIQAGTFSVQGIQTEQVIDSGQELIVHVDPHRFFEGVNFDELAAMQSPNVHIAPGTAAYQALVFGMTSTAVPMFEWTKR